MVMILDESTSCTASDKYSSRKCYDCDLDNDLMKCRNTYRVSIVHIQFVACKVKLI